MGGGLGACTVVVFCDHSGGMFFGGGIWAFTRLSFGGIYCWGGVILGGDFWWQL